MGHCFGKPAKLTPIPLLPSSQFPTSGPNNVVLPPILASLISMHRSQTGSLRGSTMSVRAGQEAEVSRAKTQVNWQEV